MKAHGLDPSMMSAYGSMNDPSNTITLYKVESTKGNRKIYLMKTGGAFSMGKNKSSDNLLYNPALSRVLFYFEVKFILC